MIILEKEFWSKVKDDNNYFFQQDAPLCKINTRIGLMNIFQFHVFLKS